MKQPKRLDVVSNELLREQVLRKIEQGFTWSELASWCGVQKRGRTRGEHCGDTSWLQRKIGVMPHQGGEVRDTIPYETAEHICRGLGLDPVDCGI